MLQNLFPWIEGVLILPRKIDLHLVLSLFITLPKNCSSIFLPTA